jgi:formate dehydrogenase subunit delta
MSATADQVTRDANLIARNLACLGTTRAAWAMADHIRRFWAPLLRTTLIAQARSHPDSFTPIATEAISQLLKDTTLETGERK